MDGHQAHAVLGVVVLFHLVVGEQGDIFHEAHQIDLGCLAGGLIDLLVAELHDGVEQFLNVLHAADALGGVFFFQQFDDADAVGDMLGQLEGIHLALQALEALDEYHEVTHLVHRAHVEVLWELVVGDALPDGGVMFVGKHHHAFDALLGHASRAVVDDPEQRLFILRVDYYTEVSQQVLDFLAVVEGEAAVDLVGDVLLAQGGFHGS